MWQWLSDILDINGGKDPAKPEPDGAEESRVGELFAQLHEYYDREKANNRRTTQLEAEIKRLREENATLREDRSDRLIQALAAQALDQSRLRRTPLTLPCSLHRQQRISFGTRSIRLEDAARDENPQEWRIPLAAKTA